MPSEAYLEGLPTLLCSTTQHLNTGVRFSVRDIEYGTKFALSEHYIDIVKHVDARC